MVFLEDHVMFKWTCYSPSITGSVEGSRRLYGSEVEKVRLLHVSFLLKYQ